MYISDPNCFEVRENQMIKGSFALRKNPNDLRDVQIKVSLRLDDGTKESSTPVKKEYFYVFT